MKRTFTRPNDELELGKLLYQEYVKHKCTIKSSELLKKVAFYLNRYIHEEVNINSFDFNSKRITTLKPQYSHTHILTGHPIYTYSQHLFLNGKPKHSWFNLKLTITVIFGIISYFMYIPLQLFAVDLAAQWHQSIYLNDISNWLANLVGLEDILPFKSDRFYFQGLLAVFFALYFSPMAIINVPLLFITVIGTNNDKKHYSDVPKGSSKQVYIYTSHEEEKLFSSGEISSKELYAKEYYKLYTNFMYSLMNDWYLKEVLHLEQVAITETNYDGSLKSTKEHPPSILSNKDLKFLNPKGGHIKNEPHNC